MTLSSSLLTDYHLQVRGRAYRIAEVELYHYSEDHPDVFTHRANEQRQWWQWYFHRTGSSFRGGTYKGLDLTLGRNGSYTGVLIRALIDGTRYIEGPCNVVTEILSAANHTSITSLVEDGEFSWLADIGLLSLVPITPTNRVVYRSSRVGLTAKDPSSDCYLVAKYRFIVEPKRVRKGRAHLALSLLQEYSVEQVVVLTGIQKNKLLDYKDPTNVGDLEQYRRRRLCITEYCALFWLLHQKP